MRRKSGDLECFTWPTAGISGVESKGDMPMFNWPSEKPGTDHIGDLYRKIQLHTCVKDFPDSPNSLYSTDGGDRRA